MKTIIIATLALFSLQLQADEKTALKHIKKLGGSLKTELVKAMKISPVKAIEVCNTKAMPLTKKASFDGVTVGRVSIKNRNPNNAVQDWMKEAVDSYENSKAEVKFKIVQIKGNKYGLIKPIKTGAVCLKCHGDLKTISSEVKEVLKKKYPNDKATGYKKGDIRGYIWATWEN